MIAKLACSKRRSIVVITSVLLLSVTPLMAGTPDSTSQVSGPRLLPPTLFYSPPLDQKALFGSAPTYSPPPPPVNEPGLFSLTRQTYVPLFEGLYTPKYETISRTESTIKGAALGFQTAWIAGALAKEANLRSNSTSWSLIGAATALGAVLGGTTLADNPSWNVRVEWADEEER